MSSLITQIITRILARQTPVWVTEQKPSVRLL